MTILFLYLRIPHLEIIYNQCAYLQFVVITHSNWMVILFCKKNINVKYFHTDYTSKMFQRNTVQLNHREKCFRICENFHTRTFVFHRKWPLKLSRWLRRCGENKAQIGEIPRLMRVRMFSYHGKNMIAYLEGSHRLKISFRLVSCAKEGQRIFISAHDSLPLRCFLTRLQRDSGTNVHASRVMTRRRCAERMSRNEEEAPRWTYRMWYM